MDWLTVNKLQSHAKKTKFMLIGSAHNLSAKGNEVTNMQISVMAHGCTLLSSTKNSGSHSNDWNFKEILEQKASSNLVYQDKRISWIGSYELLRNFVECVVKLNGKWTSPGGSAKKFTCCSIYYLVPWKTKLTNTTWRRKSSSDRNVDQCM
jgi:hypothetical protein